MTTCVERYLAGGGEPIRSLPAPGKLAELFEHDRVQLEHYRTLGIDAARELVAMRKNLIAMHQEVIRLKGTFEGQV